MSEQPDKDKVTLATIRSWVEQTIAMTTEVPARSHAAGVRHAARSVKAILDAHDLPPDAPVHFPNADDEALDDARRNAEYERYAYGKPGIRL